MWSIQTYVDFWIAICPSGQSPELIPGLFLGLTNSIGRRNDLLDLQTADDNVTDVDDTDSNVDQGYPQTSVLSRIVRLQLLENSLAPEAPKIEVFEPGLTTYPSDPEEVSVPEMITTFFALPATAASRAASVVTVVTVPPEPPVVPVFTVAH